MRPNQKTNSIVSTYSYSIRIFFVLGLITLFIAAVAAKLYNLQIVDHETYLALAASQHGEFTLIPAKRGEIYLTNEKKSQKVLVATNVAKPLVYASGKQMSESDKAFAAGKLAPILGMTKSEILDKITGGSQNYVPLKRQLSDEDEQKIKDLGLTGIHFDSEDVRFYPQNNLASQVLGFVGFTDKNDTKEGRYGIEREFEKQLAGRAGIASETGTAQGPLDGSDVYLTLDPAIQFKSQQVLEATVKKHGADSGSVIVVDPNTGAILAMANYPDFDPNNYGKAANVAYYNNNAIYSDYEPGSIFKAITMAAGLNENAVGPQSTYVDTGSIQVDDRVIKNSDPTPRGVQTMTQVLDESLNTGAVYVQQLIGRDKFRQYVHKFGFGKPTGVELPGEGNGDLGQLDKKGDIFLANMSFGQGMTVTPIQMIQAYTAIANGGVMVRPYVVDKIVHPDGSTEQKSKAELGHILDVKAASTLSAMLVDVVENGHGKKAAVPGYFIGGKTGTAQVAYKDRSGYDPNKNIGTFIGFGPMDDPSFLMLVRINEPKDVAFAESSAAPAFGEIASFILNYLQIPPTR
ncbi:MAG: penicillin-binding protein 2 [Candidatus Doudnabacteria bacterium]|nr:penicillin-binding protein 2 [Candidatus Doudnabacteria bacterium]